MKKYVGFYVGGEKYIIPIEKSREVLRMLPYLEIPHSQDFVEGVVNLRGEIIPVINMRKKFGIDESDDSGKYLIIVEIENKKFGLRIDRIIGVVDVEEKNILSPDQFGEIKKDYIQYVVKQEKDILICLLPEKIWES